MAFKRFFVRFFVVLLPIFLVLTACKKKRAFKEEDGQSAVDARMLQGHNDDLISDVNTVIIDQSLLRGRGAGISGALADKLCGLDMDTSSVYQGIVKLNYDNQICDGYRKSGQVIITFTEYPLKKWKHQGTVVKLDFIGYTVFDMASQKSVRMDGTQYLTNLSGKTWYDLYYSYEPSVVQALTGENVKVTFNGSKVAIYNFNRKMTFTYSNNLITCKVEGLGSFDGKNELENWGQNVDGDYFTSQILSPIVWRSDCGGRKPVEGEVAVKVDVKSFELKCRYAVDAEGNDVSGSDSCPFGWKMTWSYKRKTSTRVFSYI